MRICITNVLSPDPVATRNGQTLAYRVRFTSEVVAGQALFVPANMPIEQMLEQQCFVEIDYEQIEQVRIWTSPNAPSLQMVPRAQVGDYELVASVVKITPLTDDDSVVSAVIGDCTFAFTTRELGYAALCVGDIISCTIIELSLWNESF